MRGEHRIVLTALALLASPALPAMAQEAPAPGLFMNQAGIDQTIALIAARIKADQPVVFQPLVGLGGYRATLEYRQKVAGAATHEAEAEYVQVLQGSGTLITGGRLEGAQRTGPTNLTGTDIVGGTMRPIVKGDMLIIPEGTPHWFSQIDGVLVLLTMKLPRGIQPKP